MRKKTIRQWGEHPYVRTFGLLLLTVLLLVGLSALTWCEEDCSCSCSDPSCGTSKKNVGSAKKVQAHIVGGPENPLWIAPGDPVHLRMRGQAAGANPGNLNLVYTPPPGAANVQFEGRQPDERREDGSYVFNNMPVHEGGETTWQTEEINVSYDAPSPPAGQDMTIAVDNLNVQQPNGEQDSASQSYPVQSSSSASSPPIGTDLPTIPTSSEAQSATYYLWQVETWHMLESERLTTEVCQEWLEPLLQADAFIGVQFPLIGATPPYTGAYSLPVAMRDAYFPAVKLTDNTTFPPKTVLTVPLEYKPQYLTFLSTALPWKDNERWFALGVKEGASVACPPNLNLAPGKWEIKTEAWLDFGGAQNACAECVLPVYYCYEGQELPDLPVAIPAQALSLVGAAHQGWGITCVGPQLLRIADENAGNPSFFLAGMGAATVSATERVTFSHTAAKLTSGSVNVTLAATSTLGGSWTFYTDANPPIPIVAPIPLNGSSSTTWYKEFLVAGVIPAGAQAGAHTLYLTATDAANATRKTQATDMLWVGDWKAPGPHKVYFPVVMSR